VLVTAQRGGARVLPLFWMPPDALRPLLVSLQLRLLQLSNLT